mgnify:CR=1 FL=1
MVTRICLTMRPAACDRKSTHHVDRQNAPFVQFPKSAHVFSELITWFRITYRQPHKHAHVLCIIENNRVRLHYRQRRIALQTVVSGDISIFKSMKGLGRGDWYFYGRPDFFWFSKGKGARYYFKNVILNISHTVQNPKWIQILLLSEYFINSDGKQVDLWLYYLVHQPFIYYNH